LPKLVALESSDAHQVMESAVETRQRKLSGQRI
jgi:hypothetical protein